MVTSWAKYDTGCSHQMRLVAGQRWLTVSFVSAVENLCLQKKIHLIKQRPEENTTAYILRFLSEAKLAYPTAWAMGKESKEVTFLKGFTDRAFADHLLRTVLANTLRTTTEVALEKEAEQKKEHQEMDEEPIEVGAAQTNQESADGFLSILETVQRHMGQLQACMDKQKSGTTTGTEMSQHLGANKRMQAVLRTTHTDAQSTLFLNPNHCANKELTGCP